MLGSEGSAELRNGVYATAPIFPTEGTIRFGSGDAFDAGYLYAYLGGPLYQEVYERSGVTPLSLATLWPHSSAVSRAI